MNGHVLRWRASRQEDGTYRPWTCKRRVSPDYFIVIGCGESHPSRPGASKHARALNAELSEARL